MKVAVLFCALLHTVISAPVPDAEILTYLSEYGLLAENPSSPRNLQSNMESYIVAAQQELGLNATGILDEETAELMRQPHCGVTRTWRSESPRRRRFALGNSRWRRAPVTYKISNSDPTGQLHDTQVADSFRRVTTLISTFTLAAFAVHDPNSALHPEVADIVISFVPDAHDCVSHFNGSVLAHATYPWAGGDIHIRQNRNWTAFIFDAVVWHEFLHALGVDHSEFKNALMYKTYHAPEQAGIFFTPDDMEAVQALYGRKKIDADG
ncbi:matrix metalloproteinase-18-like [Thrips palmi]|uniref:Matrix metalloproteinase-18-like n=1 Tax=Thrips palmi TaxID=161013 RepID=A0A6P8YEK2_THRPL|nr:matrix metalloproteinase-18-like [Thrips palmi]